MGEPYLSKRQQQVLATCPSRLEMSYPLFDLKRNYLIQICQPGDDGSDPFISVRHAAFENCESWWLVASDTVSGEPDFSQEPTDPVFFSPCKRALIPFIRLHWDNIVRLYRDPSLGFSDLEWNRYIPSIRYKSRAYRCASVDLHTHESVRHGRLHPRPCVRRQGHRRITVQLRNRSVLRRHSESWREQSILGRKDLEMVGILKMMGGKKVYRTILISKQRTDRWHRIDMLGRTLNSDLNFGPCGIEFLEPGHGWKHIDYGELRLPLADDEACIALEKDHRCCAYYDAKVVNGSGIGDRDQYTLIIPIFQQVDKQPSRAMPFEYAR